MINLLKRVKNIVKDEKSENLNVDNTLFGSDEEKALYNFVNQLKSIESEDFLNYIEMLLNNANTINQFFDNVIINVDDEKLKNNRVALLKKLEYSIDKMINI